MRVASPDELWTPEYWEGYCETDNPYRRYKLERDRALVLALLGPRDGERILEVGCGYGRISAILLRSAAIRLVSVDRSEPMIARVTTTFAGQLATCQADAGHLPFGDGSFDGVVCNGVLMHVADQRAALTELCRVVRPGGRLVVSGNNLFSPFALPVMAWVRLRSRARQAFRTPRFYRDHLTRLGIEVRRMVGDTVLAVGLAVPGRGTPLLPRRFFGSLRFLDRWVDRSPLNYLAYETWFLGVRVR